MEGGPVPPLPVVDGDEEPGAAVLDRMGGGVPLGEKRKDRVIEEDRDIKEADEAVVKETPGENDAMPEEDRVPRDVVAKAVTVSVAGKGLPL